MSKCTISDTDDSSDDESANALTVINRARPRSKVNYDSSLFIKLNNVTFKDIQKAEKIIRFDARLGPVIQIGRDLNNSGEYGPKYRDFELEHT